MNQQQELLEQPLLDFSGDIRETLDALRPHETLWASIAAHLARTRALYEAPLAQQPDPAVVLTEACRASVAMAAAIKDLPADATPPRAMAAKVVAEMQARAQRGGGEWGSSECHGAPETLIIPPPPLLQQFIDRDHALYALLATPGLRERHWAAMEAAVGREIPHGPTTTLADMIAIGLQNRVADIADM